MFIQRSSTFRLLVWGLSNMAFQPVPDTARVAVIHSNGALPDQIVNVFYFRRAGQWSLPEIEDLAVAFRDLWIQNILPEIASQTLLRRIEVRGERAQVDVSYQLPVTPAVPGGRGGDPLPPQIAFCVTHLTGLTGRSRRGRTYFGMFTEANVSNGFLEQTLVNNLVNGLFAIRSALQNDGWTHVVVSRFENKQRLPVANTYPVVGYRAYDGVLDTQRRRAIGRGS